MCVPSAKSQQPANGRSRVTARQYEERVIGLVGSVYALIHSNKPHLTKVNVSRERGSHLVGKREICEEKNIYMVYYSFFESGAYGPVRSVPNACYRQ